ncbi:hypothetical protein P3342_005752 [Pyrenophora teres f. teres]|uniref:Uncharacterized protein n=1 Tax=Pyrenophora teres f. teres TaxID=97479 RepID=A0A6S6VY49_9PLEO|nr:hypothetical protein HRS9139_00361 [Pyrenophora teres f. teres]KAE8847933.1 hypothetical protein PTNB85_01776 [Pyrenophora teres f. teres]KAE8867859.1 hypothetical protein PTNB29_01770 [Pyrenophora teres f. teres]KAE8872624.1 hypothetical protein PTNB73_01775 [Pyrenophora teres f. teres]KAK1907426.1 hypothetical protein P3342_005752 [Pyrenophora teres f. teres]
MSSESPLEVYESAITTGKRLCKELASFKAQPPLPASLASCGYGIESGKLRSNTEVPLRAMLLSCGILISNAKYVEVRSAGMPKRGDAAYNNWFDPHHGLIVCNENYKSRDKHSGDQMIWPSEVLWQSWKGTALEAGKQASDLCAIVRLTIVNEASQIAIWQASKHSSSSRIEDNNQVEYTCLDNGFYAILGTPNGASTMRMLRDHRTELGYRIVEKIVVFGNEDLTMQMPEARTMAILLSDRRTPPSRIPIPISSSRHTS